MKLGYELTIEQSQKLVMTPELIQAIQLLQFNTQELEVYVQEELLVNPVLEREEKPEEKTDLPDQEDRQETIDNRKNEEVDWEEYYKNKEYDDIGYKQYYRVESPDEYTYEQFVPSETSLSDHLKMQLDFLKIRTPCRTVARYIIEDLDENGYLRSSVEEISKVLRVREDKVAEAVEAIQSLEPSGVGARSLKECLLIQLKNRGEADENIRRVIEDHLEDIAENRMANIAKALEIEPEEAQNICDRIKSLEPKPGRQFGGMRDNRYISPDVTVEKVGNEYVVIVNDTTAPRLNISPVYQQMLRSDDRDPDTKQFLTDKLNSAMWLIRSIEQRRQTIYNVVKAVVDYQYDFFEEGRRHMKTLTLKQIADEIGVHESTVSRSINGKYMQTPRGLFEIKYFFTSGVTGSDGKGIASESIKTIIREMVEEENPKNPISDQAMADSMVECGIDISRRTVAKYRSEMNIASSSKRRRY